MRVLVLGATGTIGSRLCAALTATSWAEPVAASRRPASGPGQLQVDTLDERSVMAALRQCDAVVNLVAGGAEAISQGAAVLARAAVLAGFPRIVHFSSLSAYGPREGVITEETPLDPTLGWYGRAKVESEQHMAAYADLGGNAITLRPGCVWGPGSELWVGRVAQWLRAGRLGDLGEAGDGWSNLVHVDDVCQAVLAALWLPPQGGAPRAFNLAAPDSPRWNRYFTDLGVAIGATPVKRLSARRLKMDAMLAGPPLKIAQMAAAKLGLKIAIPEPITPGLVGLFARQLKLDATAAQRGLGMAWTPYAAGLEQAVTWLNGQSAAHARSPQLSST
jgi:nucleoside-diphosphate-sugar epimerase